MTPRRRVRPEPRALAGAGLARSIAPLAIALALAACRSEPPGAVVARATATVAPPPASATSAPAAAPRAAPPAASAAPLAASAAPAASAPVAPASASAAPPAEPPPDPANRAKPTLESADLTERARHLFDAIVRDEPSLADDFFFPREPFVPLKDVKDAGRYFDQLLATYHRDVHKLHAERRSWDGARFVSFSLGTPPAWVAPGEEWNKIGYYRTFRGKLRWEQGGRERTIEVRTIISWNGRWYVTHLLPFKH